MNNEKPKASCGIEFITPELAEKYLTFNESNRTINSSRVSMYQKDMENGDWVFNGEPICFFDNGELKDGQHRLKAVSNCGIGQWFVVVRNIDHGAVIHDKGQSRTAAQILEIAGYPSEQRNHSALGAVPLLYACFKNDSNHERLTDSELMKFADKYGETLATAYNLTLQGAHKSPMRKSPVIAAIFCALFNGMSAWKIEEFCRIANTGFCDDESKFAAVIARNVVTAPSINNNAYRLNMFRMILLALYDFNRGTPRKRAYLVTKKPEWEERTLKAIFN